MSPVRRIGTSFRTGWVQSLAQEPTRGQSEDQATKMDRDVRSPFKFEARRNGGPARFARAAIPELCRKVWRHAPALCRAHPARRRPREDPAATLRAQSRTPMSLLAARVPFRFPASAAAGRAEPCPIAPGGGPRTCSRVGYAGNPEDSRTFPSVAARHSRLQSARIRPAQASAPVTFAYRYIAP